MKKIIDIKPAFDSPLTSVLFDLEKLRYQDIVGTTPPWLFFDLKEIVHLLESLASARIEGNRTTLIRAAEDMVDDTSNTEEEPFKELRNIRKALDFIEESMENDVVITEGYIRELHKIATDGLSVKADGSKTPGKYRCDNVEITKSKHMPPDHSAVAGLMQDLADYINSTKGAQYDIVKTAVAHHRFTAIHPFDNGNGRTARLLTYAMLSKQKFIDESGMRLLNPASLFFVNRNEYLSQLANADTGTPEALEQWCLYVGEGIQKEIERVSKLLDVKYAVPNIIRPAIKSALDKKVISENEYTILDIAIKKNDPFQAGDVKHIFGTSKSAGVQASRVLSDMKEKGLIMQLPKSRYKYVVRFFNKQLLGEVLHQMNTNNLLPDYDEVGGI